ncbi:MAG: hypothetical protein DRI28_02860 [Caldiserica bacterium]|nr:MAG: hypothetical protein DRI28_02860 [Caldisericota bacterium]
MRRWILIIIIVSVIFVFIKGKDVLSFLSIPDTVKLESVESKIVVNKKAFALLKEKIIFSPYEGRVEYFFKEGDRVPKDALVAQIETENGIFKFFAPESGIFSKKFDEVSLTENINKIEIEKYLKDNKTPKYKTLEALTILHPGDPVFRVVDNLSATLYVLKDNILDKLIEDREIFIEDEIRGEEIPIYLKGISEDLVELEMGIHVEDFINNRTPIINIIAFEGKVIKIPKRFIKRDGIMINDENNSIFISLDSLFFVKKDNYFVFPFIEENKKLFKFSGKDIIKE